MDYDGVGAFNLEVYKPFKDYPKHVIAARITAENPDEAFTPTSLRCHADFGSCEGFCESAPGAILGLSVIY